MANIYPVHGTSANAQCACRQDGQWFIRYQVNGYQGRLTWTKWQPCQEPDHAAQPNEYAGKARLPKDV